MGAVHVVEKPATRTSEFCQLTHYDFLDERIIAESVRRDKTLTSAEHSSLVTKTDLSARR
jgi:hypothetical protein